MERVNFCRIDTELSKLEIGVCGMNLYLSDEPGDLRSAGIGSAGYPLALPHAIYSSPLTRLAN